MTQRKSISEAIRRLHLAEQEAARSDTDSLDAMMADAIEDHFQSPSRARRWWLISGSAAAAALVIAASVIFMQSPGGTPPLVVHHQPDADNSGVVDMRDALLLAGAIEDGEMIDLNRDGRADAADIDLVASRAVSLKEQAG